MQNNSIAKWFLAIIMAIVAIGIGAQQSGKTEVVFWHAMGGPLGDALIELVEDFNSTHPDIHIKAINMGNYSALSTKLMASIQADEQPDVAQAFESWIANFMSADKLVPMDDFIAKDAEFRASLDDIFPVFIQSNTFDGRLWAFPFNKSVRVMYYNRDAFFRHGLDPYSCPETWDEFREYCRKLTVDEDNDGVPEVYGTTFPVSAWQFENLLLQAGGEVMSPDNITPLFNQEPGVEALKFLYALLNEDKTAYLSTGYEGQNDFLAGKVAMVEGSSVSMAYLQLTGINFYMGIGPIPVRETKRNIISGTNVVIFKGKDPKVELAAWEFVKWFTEAPQTAKWSYLTYYMPVRKSAFEEPALKERLETYPEIAAVYDQLNYSTFEPPIAEWFSARKNMEEMVIEKVLRGVLQPQEALDMAADKIANDLRQSGKDTGKGSSNHKKAKEHSYFLELMVILGTILVIIGIVWLISWIRKRAERY